MLENYYFTYFTGFQLLIYSFCWYSYSLIYSPPNTISLCTFLFLFFFNLANDCGPLSTPMNGTKTGNLTTYPNKVRFACDEGFILHGSAVRQCQPNKHWSGNKTFCEGMFHLKYLAEVSPAVHF